MDGETISIPKLKLWSRIQEQSFFNPLAKQAITHRLLIEDANRKLSPLVCKKPVKIHIPEHLVCRSSDFQIVPFYPNITTEDASGADIASENKNWYFKVTKGNFSRTPICLSTRAEWLHYFSREKLKPLKIKSPSPLPVLPPICRVQSLSPISSVISTPPTDTRRRESTKTFLLLRPVVRKPPPLAKSDPLFQAFMRVIDLKALPFKRTSEQYKFYQQKFPLLLTRNVSDGDRSATPKGRIRTPESPMSSMVNRQRYLDQRFLELDWMLEEIEQEFEEGEAFVTELKDDTFYPTRWPWATPDHAGIKRRYSIDAAMREIDSMN